MDGSISKLEIFRDITELKQIQVELKNKQDSLESIFKAAPIGIGVVVNRIFMQVNDQFCNLVSPFHQYAYTPEDRAPQQGASIHRHWMVR